MERAALAAAHGLLPALGALSSGSALTSGSAGALLLCAIGLHALVPPLASAAVGAAAGSTPSGEEGASHTL